MLEQAARAIANPAVQASAPAESARRLDEGDAYPPAFLRTNILASASANASSGSMPGSTARTP